MSNNTYLSNNTRDYKAQFQKKAENAARRASQMDVKVFQLKIQANHLNQTQSNFLNTIILKYGNENSYALTVVVSLTVIFMLLRI